MGVRAGRSLTHIKIARRAAVLYSIFVEPKKRGFAMKMELNMGTADRAIRAAVGVLLIALALFGQIGLWGYIGVVPLVTSILGYCPAYSLIGMNTCGTSKA